MFHGIDDDNVRPLVLCTRLHPQVEDHGLRRDASARGEDDVLTFELQELARPQSSMLLDDDASAYPGVSHGRQHHSKEHSEQSRKKLVMVHRSD